MKRRLMSMVLVMVLLLSAVSPVSAQSAEDSGSDDAVLTQEEEDEASSISADSSDAEAEISAAASTVTETAGGTCGEDIYWTLTSDGVLTIAGTGAMVEWTSSDDVPWHEYRSSVTSVVIEEGVSTIGYSAFYWMTSLREVSLPESLTRIGDHAFYGCSSLEEISIPSGVTTIDAYAFGECESLTSLVIPSNIISIGSYAFYQCSGMTSLSISSDLTNIGNSAFRGCAGLADEEGYVIVNNVLYEWLGSESEAEVPEDVTKISSYAFYGHSEMTSITIPQSVTSIRIYAFDACTALADVWYAGTASEWDDISLSAYNTCLTDAAIHCSDTESDSDSSVFTPLFYFTSTISDNTHYLTVGDSTTLSGRMVTKDAGIYWSISNSRVVEMTDVTLEYVSSNVYDWGITIEGLEPGSATLTGTSLDEISTSYDVTVVPKITFDIASSTTIYSPTEITCTVSLENADASYLKSYMKELEFYFYYDVGTDEEDWMKDSSCITLSSYTVAEDGLSAVYTLVAEPGDYTGQAGYIVAEDADGYTKQSNLLFLGRENTFYFNNVLFGDYSGYENVSYLTIGEDTELAGIFYETEDTESDFAAVEWEISDDSLLEIESSALADYDNYTMYSFVLTVKALRPGTVTITGTAPDGDTAQYTLVVVPRVELSVSSTTDEDTGETATEIYCTISLDEADTDFLKEYAAGLDFAYIYHTDGWLEDNWYTTAAYFGEEFWTYNDDGLYAVGVIDFVPDNYYALVGYITAEDSDGYSVQSEEIALDGISLAAGNVFPDGYDYEEDSYDFRNYSDNDVYSKKYFAALFENGSAQLLYNEKKDKENKGLCFGIAYTTAAIYNGMPSCTEIKTLLGLIARGSISEIETDDSFEIDSLSLSVDDYIKYAYVYQYSSAFISASEDTEGDALGLLALVQEMTDNGQLGITVTLYHFTENADGVMEQDGAHEVVAVGYNGNSILIDDSNHPDELQTLTVYADGSWKYSGTWSSISSDNGALAYATDYYVPYQVLQTGELVTASESSEADFLDEDNTLLYIDSSSDVDISGNLVEVDDLDETASDSDADSGSMYWVVDSTAVSITGLEDDGNTIMVGGDNALFSILTDAAGTLTVEIDGETQSAVLEDLTGGDCTIEHNTVNDDSVVSVEVTGTAAGTVGVENTSDGLAVEGFSDGTITLLIDEKIIETVEFTDADADFEVAYDDTGTSEELTVSADTVEEVISGTCGDNVSWVLNSEGALTIRGTGSMTDWASASEVPWYDYLDEITSVSVRNGVTNIGSYAFYQCGNLTEVTLPDSLTSIGAYAFYECTSLSGLILPAAMEEMGDYAFGSCCFLTDLLFEGSAPTIGTDAFYYGVMTIYYPDEDESWTESVLAEYGGTPTWSAYSGDDVPDIDTDGTAWNGFAEETAESSAGFFKWLYAQTGDADAYLAYRLIVSGQYGEEDITTEKSGEFYAATELGVKGDATTLENLQAAVYWIKYCNSLRQTDDNSSGLEDLQISSLLMAMSELDANWSSTNISHALVFSVSENLAFGYTNPFTAWYTDEKEIYDAGEDGTTGHYLNIISSSYLATGYAFSSSGGSYGTTHDQVFSSNGSFSIYTAEEYDTLVEEYSSLVETWLSESGGSGDPAVYTLSLYDGEELLSSASVTYGDTVSIADLTEPSKEGYNFAGWVDSEGNAVTEDITVTGDITLYASWTVNTYILNFYSDGKLVSIRTCEYGEIVEVDSLPTLTKEGYTFAGWTDEDGNAVTEDITVTGEITLYASWTANTYTLSLYDGDELLSSESVTYGDTVSIADLTEPSKEGYTFAGWVDADGNAVTEDITVTGEITLYASWTANTYTLSLYDGDELLSSESVTYGDTVSIADLTEPSKEGYTFAGWTDAEGNAVTEDITVTGDVTLYASWTVNTYILNFYSDGKLVSIRTCEYGETVDVDSLPTLTKEGYTFAGWTDKDGNGVTEDITVTGEITLYASWTANAYTLSLYDGDELLSSESVTYGDTVSIADLTEPTKDGYTFAGWTDEEGNAVTEDITVTGDITLYASWTVNTYILNFYSDGKLVSIRTCEYGETVEVDSLPTLTKEGYTFAGWTDADGNAVTEDIKVTGEITLYASWTANTYMLSLYDGDELLSSESVTYGDTVSIADLTEPTKEGYTFAGWTDEEGDAVTEDITVTGDITLYASWTAKDADSPSDIAYAEAVLSSESYTYDGSACTPSVTVTDADGNELTENEDYTVSYSNNVDAGTATVVIKGIGDYSGTKELNFTIKAQSLSSSNVSLSYTTKTYTGSAFSPSVTVVDAYGNKLKVGQDGEGDYTLTTPSGRKNAGTYTYVIKGTGNYTGTVKKTLTIKPVSIKTYCASCTLSTTSYTYSGSAKKPSVTLKVKVNGKTKTLSKVSSSSSSGYTVSYKNNTKIGKATVTITGTGNYTGTITKTFKIYPKKGTISSLKSSAKKKMTVKWKTISGSVTKYQVRYRVKGTSKWTTKTYSSSTKSKTITGLKSGKTYQVQVRAYKTVNGEKYCGSWSSTKTVKVK